MTKDWKQRVGESVAQAKEKLAAEIASQEQKATRYEAMVNDVINPAVQEFGGFLRDQYGLNPDIDRTAIRLPAIGSWEIRPDDSFAGGFALVQLYPASPGSAEKRSRGGKQEIVLEGLTKETLLSMLATWFEDVVRSAPHLVR